MLKRIGFGGGCHWCTEAVFQALNGVHEVHQGFIRSDPPDDGWSEAVELLYDPDVIALGDLIAVHLATHASSSEHKMRGKYRSAIYVDGDAGEAEAALSALEDETGASFVTCVLPNGGFKASDERFRNYYAKDPERPFCQTYIDPKLAKLRARFSGLMKGNGETA